MVRMMLVDGMLVVSVVKYGVVRSSIQCQFAKSGCSFSSLFLLSVFFFASSLSLSYFFLLLFPFIRCWLLVSLSPKRIGLLSWKPREVLSLARSCAGLKVPLL